MNNMGTLCKSLDCWFLLKTRQNPKTRCPGTEGLHRVCLDMGPDCPPTEDTALWSPVPTGLIFHRFALSAAVSVGGRDPRAGGKCNVGLCFFPFPKR